MCRGVIFGHELRQREILRVARTSGFEVRGLSSAPYPNLEKPQTAKPTGCATCYEANGNLISKTDSGGTTSYSWDAENRLASVTLPGSAGTVSYQYDPFGRRIEKISPSGTTVYAYDGDNVVEELDGGGTAVARYAQGLGIDEPLAMYRGGASYYYNADGLGSITSLTNSSGQIAATYSYDSFGKLTASTGTVTNPFRYTGREYGSDTGLYYYRARYYDSSVGRFISEDPIRFAAGPDFYVYVGNRPLMYRDPFGLQDSAWPAMSPQSDPAFQFGESAGDMWKNYRRMEQRNWKGADKWYHCMANCQATNEGPGGAAAARVISFVRTDVMSRVREPGDWKNDDKANKCGQKGGDCEKTCEHFVPPSSPGKPPFPGW